MSIALHYVALPGSLLPRHSFEIHDVDGTLTIPVDVLMDKSPPPPAAPPPAPSSPKEAKAPVTAEPSPEGTALRHRDAGAFAKVDAGDSDGGSSGDVEVADASTDAEGGIFEEGGIASSEDAAAPSGSARDAVGMIGTAGNVQAGPQNVVLTVNMSAIRNHPEGKRVGPLISAVPQWDDFLVGTGIDPLRDIDWVSINGP